MEKFPSLAEKSIAPVLVAAELCAGWSSGHKVQASFLEFLPGSIVVILGPNGVGKTTLLRTLSGQLLPQSGRVLLDNADISSYSSEQLASKLAYVAQFNQTNGRLSVKELVALGRNPYQNWWSWALSPADREKIEQAMQVTNVQHLACRSYGQLSGGEQQRVALAVAMAQDTPIMLLDEPTAHLDLAAQNDLVRILLALKARGKLLVCVLHDLNLAARLADFVVFLSKLPDQRSSASCVVPAGQAFCLDKLSQVFSVPMQKLCDEQSGEYAYLPLWDLSCQ